MLDQAKITETATKRFNAGKVSRAERRAAGEVLPSDDVIWGNCLRTARRDAEAELVEAPAPVALSPIDAALFDLNVKDHWTAADYRRADELRADRREAA